MLPPQARLRRREEFTATVRRGARAATPTLVVHLAAADGAQPTRAGFVVSRAVGSAVIRNRTRRRLRHLLRARLDRIPPGGRLVVRALPPAATATTATLGQHLDRALARLTVSAAVR